MVTDRLRRHRGARPTADAAPVPAGPCTLADLRPGRCGVVTEVADDVDPASARRMVDLGFAPGARVEVVRRAPLADPVVFRVASYEVALRRAQARCIRVTPVS